MSKPKIPTRLSFEPFDQDVLANGGYWYSRRAPLSSRLSNNYLTQITQQEISRILKHHPIKTAIDLGCGDGVFTNQLAKKFKLIKFTGTDAAKQAIVSAQLNYPRVHFQFWDLMRPNSKFRYDLAILRGVIHHLPDPVRGIKHTASICQHLIVIEPNGWNLILKIIEKVSPYHRAHHERSFTSRKISSWYSQYGLKLVDQKFVGLVPFFCPSWLAKMLKQLEPLVERSWLAPLLCAQVVQIYQQSSLE